MAPSVRFAAPAAVTAGVVLGIAGVAAADPQPAIDVPVGWPAREPDQPEAHAAVMSLCIKRS